MPRATRPGGSFGRRRGRGDASTPRGRRGTRGGTEPPRDERTILQVLLGDLVFAALAGAVYALLGGDAVESITFGAIVYVIFLFLDLQVRRRQRERDGGGPGVG